MKRNVISDTRWQQPLQDRTYLKSFSIPKLIKQLNLIADGTKRKFLIELSTGKAYDGVFTISSGNEIQFPKAFIEIINGSEYFVAEIVDGETYEEDPWFKEIEAKEIPLIHAEKGISEDSNLMKTMTNNLLSKTWKLLSIENLKPKKCADDMFRPGVYAIAYTDKGIIDQKVQMQDIFYIGMTNSLRGVNQRLNQFYAGIRKNTSHSGGMHFFQDYTISEGWDSYKEKTGYRLYFSYTTLECVVSKEKRKPADLMIMGEIAKFEYYLIAKFKDLFNKEPELNKK